MQQQESLYKSPNHAANLNNMRLEEEWCDVTIKINGREIRAHKVILAANLKYFATMLSKDSFRESKEGVIVMESVEATDLEAFVSYAYTGEILLTEANALNLLELANYLSEDDIKEACVVFLEKHLKVEEACRAYKFAATIDCLPLKNTAREKIIMNFRDFSESPDYLNFDSENLLDILSNGKAQAKQLQKLLFEGIIRWIKHDAKERKMCLEDLLSSIDVTTLNSDDVNNCLYKYLAEYDDEYGITKDTMFFCEASKIKRKEQEKVLMLIGNTGSVQFYNFIERKWSQPEEISNAAFIFYANFSCAVLNNKLHYTSSNSSGENCLQVFDPLSKRISRFNPSSRILSRATLCACNQFLYICGGMKQDHASSKRVLRYDPQTNSLKTLTSMGTKRYSAASIFYQDCLHVLGGYNDLSFLQSVEKYDPVRKEWTAVASMCQKRYGHAVAELNGKLYACGGYSGLNFESNVEVYDPTTNCWQMVASMNKARGCFLVVAHEGKLLAIGGEKEKTVEVYDPSEDQWRMNDDMSSSLQVAYCVGGLFLSSCIAST